MELVKASHAKAVAEVARDLGIDDTTLGNWVKADRAERGVPDETGLLPLTASERAELTRLRRENATLKIEREILTKSVLGLTPAEPKTGGGPEEHRRRLLRSYGRRATYSAKVIREPT